ncbi:MAG: PKD domain-containing protein [Owenweeksia sp.]|nr:PKD domain-containing protein [Owenweeksia sp.]
MQPVRPVSWWIRWALVILTALLYNTSSRLNADTNYSITYQWDFGDGNSSNQAFPTHSYDTTGAYAVCLSISSTDSLGFVCQSTYCDTLGIDTSGKLIYKNTGFTIQVLDGANISLEEVDIQQLYSIYPEPGS